MYLNVNLAASNNGSAESSSGGGGGLGSCTTPRTPDILNLLAGAPFDNVGPYSSSVGHGRSSLATTANGQQLHHHQHHNQPATSSSYYHPCSSGSGGGGMAAMVAAGSASTPGDGPSSPGEHASSSFSSFSSLCSSPTTPSTPPGPPSIQNTRTYLIKEGLKLTIQSKRLASGRSSLDHDQILNSPLKDEMGHQLTTEDEERRRRRRERNKVAATKCRNRKKERTGILMTESDVLEDQNVNFRSEIQRLETEKRRLMDVLAMHSPNCLKTSGGSQTPVSCSTSEYIHHDPGNISGQQQGSHYTAMSTSLPSSSYMYDCRSSSESAAMAGSVPHHQQQHHSTSSSYELAGTPSESCAAFNTGDMAYNHQQVNNMVQQQQQHRVSYTGDNPNYR